MKEVKMINIKTSIDTHKKIYALATIKGISLNNAVNEAIEDYIAKHRELILSLFNAKIEKTG